MIWDIEVNFTSILVLEDVPGPCPSLHDRVMPRKLDAIEAYILSLNNNNNSIPDYLEIA